jgi:hypothetical protein
MAFARFHQTKSFQQPSGWISDDWLCSFLATRLFFLSTLCVLGLTPAFMRAYENRPANWIRLPWEALGFLVPIGVLFLFFGMLRYWIRIDNSGVWTKRLWLVILLVGFWWGSIPYYYFVYLAQIIRRHRAAI